MNFIRLSNTEVIGKRVFFHFEVSDNLKDYFTTNVLWIEYGGDMSALPVSILNCAFVGVTLAAAWITGSRLFVDRLDSRFYRSISRLREAYSDIYPKSHLKGFVVPSEIIQNNEQQKRSLTDGLILYSGGADCLTSYIRHSNEKLLFCNIYGWLTNHNEQNHVFEADFNDVGSFAEQHNGLFEAVKSNFAKLGSKKLDKLSKKNCGFEYWFGFLHSMAFISIAIPICFEHGISKIYIASSYHPRTPEVCASYATTDAEFQFGKLGYVIHDGFNLCRQDKIGVIANYQKAIDKNLSMRVCSFNDHNCLTCEKCFRTVAGLIAENADPHNFGFKFTKPVALFYQNYFSDVKNMAYWGAVKENYYYEFIRQQMRLNYENIVDREFVDWFLNFDFIKEKKKAVWKYRRKNFFKLVKKHLLHR